MCVYIHIYVCLYTYIINTHVYNIRIYTKQFTDDRSCLLAANARLEVLTHSESKLDTNKLVLI